MSITKEQFQKIERFVEAKLDSLNWQHTLQVRDMALKLARSEKADKEMVEVSALFHDIGKIKGDEGHVQRSVEMARKYLGKEDFKQRFIEEVIYGIICHEYYRQDKQQLILTLEAKILSDADLLSNFSSLGIVKSAIHKEKELRQDLPKAIKEIIAKAEKRSRQLLTNSGAKEAQERVRGIKNFYRLVL